MKKVLCIILFILAPGGAVMTVAADSEATEQEINGILRYSCRCGKRIRKRSHLGIARAFYLSIYG